jgi:hypothetical protein
MTQLEQWQVAWPRALDVWSRFTRLREPLLCASSVTAAAEGLQGSFAMIRLADQTVVVDLQAVATAQLDEYALEILAHEIGHHVLSPATATDHFRLLARIRAGLPTLQQHAPMIANLYADLLINDRLQRHAGLRMDEIYARMNRHAGASEAKRDLWALYMRIYEVLWQLEPGTLTPKDNDETFATDAWLGSRVIRTYAQDWLTGAGRFAALVLPYLVREQQAVQLAWLHDTRSAAHGCDTLGLDDVEAGERESVLHPAHDAAVTGIENAAGDPLTSNTGAQTREPFEFGEILKAAGVTLSDHDIAVTYYRNRARRHLIAMPRRTIRSSTEPLPEGLESWDIGAPLDDIDWLQTLVQSPHVIPGVTTVQRVHGLVPVEEPDPQSTDLDLYVDSSGSMPDPQRQTSWLTLAGAIVAISALRAGARVQVTLWSGKDEVTHTDGFVRDEQAILRVLTGFYGGATCFPIHRLRETYAHRPATERPVHLLMISDDGITTMFDDDERGNSGWTVARQALTSARGGGTMVLNLPTGELWDSYYRDAAKTLARAEQELGWRVERVTDWPELVEFARRFSRDHYVRNRRGSSHAA